jgi:hypothetical protein
MPNLADQQSLLQGHPHLPALCQGIEDPRGLGRIFRADRNRKSLRLEIAAVRTIRPRDHAASSGESRVDHLIVHRCRHFARFRRLAVGDHLQLSAQRLFVKLESLFTVSQEQQIWSHNKWKCLQRSAAEALQSF